MASTNWIVVADGARARILSAKDRLRFHDLAVVEELETDNRPSREIASDKPGRTYDSGGAGRHAKEEPTDPHRHQQDVFAAELAELLDKKRKAGTFDALMVVAPPRMLGDLRSHMSAELARMVTSEMNKDLTKVAVADLPGHLSDFIES